MSTLDSYSPLGCWLLLVYHLKYQMTSLIRMFPEMGVPPSHHGFKNPKIPSHGHHSDDLGYPHDFTKKKSFRSVWTWVHSHLFPRGFLRFSPGPWPSPPAVFRSRARKLSPRTFLAQATWIAPKGLGISTFGEHQTWRNSMKNGPKKDGSMRINGFSHGLMDWPKGFFEEVMVSRRKIIPSAAILEHWDMTLERWNPKNV